MDKIEQICLSNGYCIIIKPLDKILGCSVEFPAKIFKPNIEAKLKTYIITDNGIEIYTSINDETKSRSLILNNYVKRPAIIGDILKEASRLNIDEKLIFIQSEDVFLNIENLFGILYTNLSDEEEIKEQKLLKLLPLLIIGEKMKLGADSDIEKDYNVLLNFFVKGELK